MTTEKTPQNTKERVWFGDKPCCDFCSQTPTRFFVDGATIMGPWGIMCQSCYPRYGRGLGQGRGQKYQLRASDQKWVKVAG